MSKLDQALAFAAQKHVGQTRNDKKTPYIVHPFRVVLILSREFGVTDDQVLIAASVHDTIEDTNTDHDELQEMFGSTVAGWVVTLTKNRCLTRSDMLEEHYDNLELAPKEVRIIKMADTLDNLRDSKGGRGNVKKTLAKANRIMDLCPVDEYFRPAITVMAKEIADVRATYGEV